MEAIATKFEIRGKGAPAGQYLGPILVAQDAVYLVVTQHVNAALQGARMSGMGGLIGGLVGAGIGAIIDRHKQTMKDTFWEPLTTLPECVVTHASLQDSKLSSKVHTLRREDVTSLKFGRLTGVTITIDGASVFAQLMPWGVAKAQKVFQEFAWPQASD